MTDEASSDQEPVRIAEVIAALSLAIGTLVGHTTGFAMLVALPDGYKPEHVAPALTAKIRTLPDALRRSLTWDRGPESIERTFRPCRPASAETIEPFPQRAGRPALRP